MRGTPDVFAAAGWYEKAARQGHGDAQFKLGLLYYQGRGLARDRAAAAEWYAKAAESGSTGAQYNLALMAERGVSMAPDAARAARLFEKAADGGMARGAPSGSTTGFCRARRRPNDAGTRIRELPIAMKSGFSNPGFP